MFQNYYGQFLKKCCKSYNNEGFKFHFAVPCNDLNFTDDDDTPMNLLIESK